MTFETVSARVPCYNGEIKWPPHAVVTTDATQFFWLQNDDAIRYRRIILAVK